MPSRMPLGNVESVREIIAAINARNVDGVLARLAPDFEWRPLEGSPAARVARGHEQVRSYVEDWLGTFDDLRLELEEPTEIGDHVVVVVRGSARGRASGLELENRFCQVWTLRQGTALRMKEYPTRELGLAAVS